MKVAQGEIRAPIGTTAAALNRRHLILVKERQRSYWIQGKVQRQSILVKEQVVVLLGEKNI